MTAVDRALRHIEKYLAARHQRPASAKAASRSSRGAPKRPEPARDFRPPRVDPDITRVYESLPEVFGLPLPNEWSITAERTRAVSPMTDKEARAFGILPDGEVADDWLKNEHISDVVDAAAQHQPESA